MAYRGDKEVQRPQIDRGRWIVLAREPTVRLLGRDMQRFGEARFAAERGGCSTQRFGMYGGFAHGASAVASAAPL